MVKGTYTLNEGNISGPPPPSKNVTLFKSCVCITLAFIAICVIFLIARTMRNKEPEDEVKREGVYSLGSQGNGMKTTDTSEIFTKNVPTEFSTRINTIRNTVSPVRNDNVNEPSIGPTKNYNKEESSNNATEANTIPLIFTGYTTKGKEVFETVPTNRITTSILPASTKGTHTSPVQSGTTKNAATKSTLKSNSTRLSNTFPTKSHKETTLLPAFINTQSTDRNKLKDNEDLGNNIGKTTEMVNENTERTTELPIATAGSTKTSTITVKSESTTLNEQTNQTSSATENQPLYGIQGTKYIFTEKSATSTRNTPLMTTTNEYKPTVRNTITDNATPSNISTTSVNVLPIQPTTPVLKRHSIAEETTEVTGVVTTVEQPAQITEDSGRKLIGKTTTEPITVLTTTGNMLPVQPTTQTGAKRHPQGTTVLATAVPVQPTTSNSKKLVQETTTESAMVVTTIANMLPVQPTTETKTGLKINPIAETTTETAAGPRRKPVEKTTTESATTAAGMLPVQLTTETKTGPKINPIAETTTETATDPRRKPVEKTTTESATTAAGMLPVQPTTETKTGPKINPIAETTTETATDPRRKPVEKTTTESATTAAGMLPVQLTTETKTGPKINPIAETTTETATDPRRKPVEKTTTESETTAAGMLPVQLTTETKTGPKINPIPETTETATDPRRKPVEKTTTESATTAAGMLPVQLTTETKTGPKINPIAETTTETATDPRRNPVGETTAAATASVLPVQPTSQTTSSKINLIAEETTAINELPAQPTTYTTTDSRNKPIAETTAEPPAKTTELLTTKISEVTAHPTFGLWNRNLIDTVLSTTIDGPREYHIAEVGGESYEDYENEITAISPYHTMQPPPMKRLTSNAPSDTMTTEGDFNTKPTEKNNMPWLQETNAVTHSTVSSKNPEFVCDSVECKSAASRMLSLMDHSVNPCHDFYEFSCGGTAADSTDSHTWKRLSRQLYSINDNSTSYAQKFKIFYDSCIAHEHNFRYQDRIDAVLKLVQEVGEILDENTPNDTTNMTQLFSNLILRQSFPFMDIDIDIDAETSEFILKLTPPRPISILTENGRWSALTETQKRCLDEQRHELQQLNLDLTKIYNSYLTCQKNHTIYLDSIETVVQALGFYSHLNNTFNKNQQIQERRTTMEWDILEVLNILPLSSTIKQEALFKDYIILNISDLQVQYPLIDWKKLFSTLTGGSLKDNTTIYLYSEAYFNNTFEKLQKIDNWKLNNVLIAIYAHNLYENFLIPQARFSRENYCLKLSSKLFPDVSSNLFMKTWPENEVEESQMILTEIFDRLKENLTSAFQEEQWLDSSSKKSALLKLKKLKLILNKQGNNNEEELNNKYSSVIMNKIFEQNTVEMLEVRTKNRLSLVGKQFSAHYLWSYFLNVYDDQPISFYSKGLIVAPLGMINRPMNRLPGYITMAQIGLSLAKEIGRHFDPIGIQTGMTLSGESQPSYTSLKVIMENDSLFNLFKFARNHILSFVANPKLSLNSRIAENTGFRLISDTFDSFGNQSLLPWASTSFSIDQIFHITVAQEYCQKTDMFKYMQQLFESEILPAPLRVENIVRNSKHFSKSFNCPLYAPMSKNRRKKQFPHLLEEEIEL